MENENSKRDNLKLICYNDKVILLELIVHFLMNIVHNYSKPYMLYML